MAKKILHIPRVQSCTPSEIESSVMLQTFGQQLRDDQTSQQQPEMAVLSKLLLPAMQKRGAENRQPQLCLL